MKKNLIISTFKNVNGTKVNVLFTGVECLFFVPNWGAVCFARVDEKESERAQKTIYHIWGDVGTRSFESYKKKLQKLYKENGISKPCEMISESAGSGFFASLDINISL